MRLLCLHVDCVSVVEQTDRMIVDVGEFHGSSVSGVTQLQWRLEESEQQGLIIST